MRKGFLLLLISVMGFSCSETKKQIVNYSDGSIVAAWVDNLTEAIMVDMFSPPVASRIYSYSNIAAMEALRHAAKPTKATLAGILNGLDSLPQPKSELDFRVAGLVAFSEVAASMVYTKQIVRNYETHWLDSIQKTTEDKGFFEKSVAYGKELGQAIIRWASKDNFRETRGMVRYTLLHEPGSWEPTPPEFLPGAEPHWNKIRPFILDSASQLRPDSLPVAFNTATSTLFYENAMEVMKNGTGEDSVKRNMAIFWDDNPGVSAVSGHMKQIRKKMTPGGHWMAVTGIVVRKKHLDMAAAAEVFAITSIATTDAFIACWDSKFHFQTIRPITYIHRHITTDWVPLLQTPPFPEFPSGHATISAAAATALTSCAGDNFTYTDSTEFRFGLPVRSFTSFMEAAKECAASRFYGGIHFMPSNEAGTNMGTIVGMKVVQKTGRGAGL